MMLMGEPLTAILEAERAGFDSSLIEESLALSHEQRAIQHQRALDLALEMERAGRILRDQDLLAVKELKAIREKQSKA